MATGAQGGKLLREVIQADESAVVLGTSKFFFTYSLDNAFLGPINIGATTIVIESWPEPEQVVEQIARHRPNVVFSVPTFYRRLLGLGAERLSPLRNVAHFYSAGERLPDAIALAWREAVGKDIHSCYGMSESFVNTLGCLPGRQPLGATGLLLNGVQARLLDNTGRAVIAGEPGVMWIQHPSLALGYLDPEATGLYVRRPGGGFDRVEGVPAAGLLRVPSGTGVESLISYPEQDAADGRVLVITFREGRRTFRVDFPLGDLVTVAPPPAPTTTADGGRTTG